jgi:hypothetical protein
VALKNEGSNPSTHPTQQPNQGFVPLHWSNQTLHPPNSHTGATVTYDSYMYEPGADILKPEVSLIINSPSVIFPESYAGDTGVTANENPIQLIPQAVVGMEHVPVVFELSHSGTNMVNGGNIIPVGSIVWSTTPQITSNSLSVGNQIIASGVTEGTVIDVYYWLNVPMPQTEGNYSGTIDFHFIAD